MPVRNSARLSTAMVERRAMARRAPVRVRSSRSPDPGSASACSRSVPIRRACRTPSASEPVEGEGEQDGEGRQPGPRLAEKQGCAAHVRGHEGSDADRQVGAAERAEEPHPRLLVETAAGRRDHHEDRRQAADPDRGAEQADRSENPVTSRGLCRRPADLYCDTSGPLRGTAR